MVYCRRANGVPVSLFAGYLSEHIETERGTPRSCDSSAGVRRYERLPGEVHMPVGVFDDPEVFEPRAPSRASQQLSWF